MFGGSSWLGLYWSQRSGAATWLLATLPLATSRPRFQLLAETQGSLSVKGSTAPYAGPGGNVGGYPGDGIRGR